MARKRRTLLTLSEQQEMLLLLRAINAEFRSKPLSPVRFTLEFVEHVNSLVFRTRNVELMTVGSTDHAPLPERAPASRTAQDHQGAPYIPAPAPPDLDDA